MTIEGAQGPAHRIAAEMASNSPWATTREPPRRRGGESVEAKILSRIGASVPYFALENCVFDATELRAEAPSETEAENELGPASSAEVVRHALVTGLSCLALGRPDDGRSYYLPSSVDATFFASPAPFGGRIAYSAIGATQSPVGGSAQVEARVARELLARLNVSFAVVEEHLFTRLFVAHKTTTFGDMGSYEDYQPFATCSHDAHCAQAGVVIESSDCRGHFYQYPALPVSTLLGQLVRLSARLLPGGFRIGALKLRAPSIAWAGEQLDLRVTRTAGPWSLSARAAVAGRTVLSLDLAIQGVASFPRQLAR